jgi:predicted transcriptional regulator
LARVAARLLSPQAGLNQREIGRALGVRTGTAVSQHLKRLEEALLNDQELNRRVHALEQQLRT